MVLFFSDSSRSSDLFTYISGIDPTEAFLELIYAPRLTGSAEEWFLLMRYKNKYIFVIKFPEI